ncbi:MAG: DUF4167 domain-containing protein [Pseudomonadota bacterium]
MRSSKSRSRNKNRNNRPSGGNIVNRVFDSSGPEGKVRGTPQQIIDKYNQLARDAQLAGDRVAVENFQQHAEHYTRMLAAAQKEIEARQQQNQQNQQGNQQAPQQGQGAPSAGQDGGAPQAQQSDNGGGRRSRNRRDDRGDSGDVAPGQGDQPDVIDPQPDTGLVETPEAKSEAPAEPAEKPKRTRTRRKAPKTDAPKDDATGDAPVAETPPAEEAPASEG